MSEEPRTLLDLVELLIVSGGLSPGDSLRLSREIDAAFGLSAKSGGSTPAQRERWRRKKERQRERKRNVPGGQEAEAIIYKEDKIPSVKGRKKEPAKCPPGDVPPPADGWPVDYLDQFWQAFPPYRRESKRKVGEKLERIRATGKVAWEQIIGAVRRYAATDPGQFACAPLVWLNGERWDREYGAEVKTNGGSNEANRIKPAVARGSGHTLAARLRRSVGAREGNGGQAPAGGEPDDGPADPAERLQLVESGGRPAAAPPPTHR